MSSKQLKKILIAVVGLLAVVFGVIYLLFFFDTGVDTTDTEAIKAAGGYELLKTDCVDMLRTRDSQAATIGNLFFDEVGIIKYEGMDNTTRKDTKGNVVVYADGYELDCLIRSGEFANAYIGEILVFKNSKVTSSTISGAYEMSFNQYKTAVEIFKKATKLDEIDSKTVYAKMTKIGINSLANIKSGKLNGVKGFYGDEGVFKYFFTLAGSELDKVYVVCDGFEPILIYSKNAGVETLDLKNVKVLQGKRQGIAGVLAYKIKQATELEVVLPAAILNGDDAWLMVNDNKGTIYIEVKGEVKDGDSKKTEDFVIKIQDVTNELKYLKIGRKVYMEK